MTRKDAQDFFREHSNFWGNNMEDRAYKVHFDEAVKAIMNDDPLVPIPCPFCGKTEITFKDGSNYKWQLAECNECGARCGEVRVPPMEPGMVGEKWLEHVGQIIIAEWNKRA